MTDAGHDAVIKVSYSGQVLGSYALTTRASPQRIALGPDGNVWVAKFGTRKIARVTPSGTVTEFATPSGTSCGIWDCSKSRRGRLKRWEPSNGFGDSTIPYSSLLSRYCMRTVLLGLTSAAAHPAVVRIRA